MRNFLGEFRSVCIMLSGWPFLLVEIVTVRTVSNQNNKGCTIISEKQFFQETDEDYSCSPCRPTSLKGGRLSFPKFLLALQCCSAFRVDA